MSSLLGQIKEALVAFAGLKTPPALIGGLALASHGVVRATRDVDFLIDADDADRLHDILLGLGYLCLHRSEDAANYLRGEDGFDVLYAHRPTARKLLCEADERQTGFGRLRVIGAEGLIAFKLQPMSTTRRGAAIWTTSAPCSRPMPVSSTWTKCGATLHSSIRKICWRR